MRGLCEINRRTSDIDEKTWRERTAVASTRPRATSPSASINPMRSAINPTNTSTVQSPKWNLDPLVPAGMDDMLELIQVNEGQPMGRWFHSLIAALAIAEMSDEQFLQAASRESPADLVDSIVTLSYCNEEKALGRLLHLSAQNQPAEDIPVITVLLRGDEDHDGRALAKRLIDVLCGEDKGAFSIPTRDDIVLVAVALHRATLAKNSSRLIKGIGKFASPKIILEATEGPLREIKYANENLLYAVGGGSDWHLKFVLQALRKASIEEDMRYKVLGGIALGISSEEAQHKADWLNNEGMPEEAEFIVQYERPPF